MKHIAFLLLITLLYWQLRKSGDKTPVSQDRRQIRWDRSVGNTHEQQGPFLCGLWLNALFVDESTAFVVSLVLKRIDWVIDRACLSDVPGLCLSKVSIDEHTACRLKGHVLFAAFTVEMMLHPTLSKLYPTEAFLD